jgi:hypothetical protein
MRSRAQSLGLNLPCPRVRTPRDRGDFAGRAAKQRRSRRRFRPIGGDETAAAGN